MLTTRTEQIKNCRATLEEIFKGSLDLYIDLFFYEREAVLTKKQSENLSKAGVIRPVGDKWVANVMVFPFRNKFIATDFLLSNYRQENGKYKRNLDDVWVMFPHETLLFIERLGNIKGGLALDIASGSGAISLFLADKFAKVISADINPKAVAYARFNTILNDLEDKIVNTESNLFTSLSQYKFDYICWNGPTVAMPEVKTPENVYPLYTYGGYDGAQFTKKFLKQVFKYTETNFKIKWWDGSLGDSKQSVVEKYIRSSLSHLSIKVTIEFLNKRRGVPLEEYDRSYIKYCQNKFDLSQSSHNHDQAVKKWYGQLKEGRLTHVYITLISIEPSGSFEVIYKDTPKTFVGPRQVFGFEWHFVSRGFIKKYLLANN